MNEELILFLWQYQYFETKNLKTTQNINLQVIKTGVRNHQTGSDFWFSEIVLDQVRLFGNVEIHVKTSDWLKHKHHENVQYDSVILHIVWEHDLEEDIMRTDNTFIPTLEIKYLVNPIIIEKYIFLKENPILISCQSYWKNIDINIKKETIKSVFLERIKRKSEYFLDIYKKNNQDLEETTFQILGKSFGFKNNALGFEQLTKSISLKIIQKYANDILQIEALLFGQAGFLESPIDDYAKSLKNEYDFLKYKHQLETSDKHIWAFGKLRPANSPSLRIAQFAALLFSQKAFVMEILHYEKYNLYKIFETKASIYWENHYDFGKESSQNWSKMGKTSLDLILINTVAPLLYFYGYLKNERIFLEKALDLIEHIKPEKNHITQLWENLEFFPKNAVESQGLLELYQNYCSQKRCLHCHIGRTILK